MAAISQTAFFKIIFMNAELFISIRISLKFVHKGPVDKTPTLVQVKSWHRIRDKLLPQTMVTHFKDAYMQH